MRLADNCQARGIAFHLICLRGMAEEALAIHPGDTVSIAEAGKIFRILHEQSCDAVVMAGLVRRPDFRALKPDWRGAAMLPKLARAASKGDGAILAALVDLFEADGFLVIGAEEILSDSTGGPGALGKCTPTDSDRNDISKARDIVRALGPFDIGQGAVVADGQVLGIEAIEGTDELLMRCTGLRDRLTRDGRFGVLVKIPKPGQELRVDLPTIGPRTVENAIAAGLNGIAYAAGQALIVDQAETIALADANEIFLYGLTNSNEELSAAMSPVTNKTE